MACCSLTSAQSLTATTHRPSPAAHCCSLYHGPLCFTPWPFVCPLLSFHSDDSQVVRIAAKQTIFPHTARRRLLELSPRPDTTTAPRFLLFDQLFFQPENASPQFAFRLGAILVQLDRRLLRPVIRPPTLTKLESSSSLRLPTSSLTLRRADSPLSVPLSTTNMDAPEPDTPFAAVSAQTTKLGRVGRPSPLSSFPSD